MRSVSILAAAAAAVILSACGSMDGANAKMQAVDKKVSEADAKFRKKVGLDPYKKNPQAAAADSN